MWCFVSIAVQLCSHGLCCWCHLTTHGCCEILQLGVCEVEHVHQLQRRASEEILQRNTYKVIGGDNREAKMTGRQPCLASDDAMLLQLCRNVNRHSFDSQQLFGRHGCGCDRRGYPKYVPKPRPLYPCIKTRLLSHNVQRGQWW